MKYNSNIKRNFDIHFISCPPGKAKCDNTL